ncbi:hypothetical protein EV360DRAFT_87814 [Lentinula raphanica]|nr:hypothetical protein EV360DRAFT_87814 [Lentinula raphanica]
MAIVLHPSLKVDYLRQAKWEETWVNNAIAITPEYWENNFKPTQANMSGNSQGTEQQSTPVESNSFFSSMAKHTQVAPVSNDTDELEHFLAEDSIQALPSSQYQSIQSQHRLSALNVHSLADAYLYLTSKTDFTLQPSEHSSASDDDAVVFVDDEASL